MEVFINMRIVALCACAFLAAPVLVLAEETAPDPSALGMAEAILSYCAKVDPAASERYQQQGKLLVQDASKEALEKVRRSSEYQQAYAAANESVDKLDEHKAKQVCSSSLPSGK